MSQDLEDMLLGSYRQPTASEPRDGNSITSIPESLKATYTLYDHLMDRTITLTSLHNSDVLKEINQKLQAEKDGMQTQCTSKLWLQYLQMISILKTFIKAERTGNWQLHFKSMQDRLPYLAASGHNNYTKLVHLYL
jgi:hypothetical protein